MVTDTLQWLSFSTGNAAHLTGVRRSRTDRVASFRFWPQFWKSLVAILAGNVVYFLMLAPHMPAVAQHAPNRLDIGLLIDFWVCLVCYGVLELLLAIVRKGPRTG